MTRQVIDRAKADVTMGRRGDYGFDAPYALVAFATVGAACAVVAIASLWSQQTVAGAQTRRTSGDC
jgi:hypothetical protein